MRAFQADALIMRAIQTGASNASDVQVQVMCKCELVALGGGECERVGSCYNYWINQPPKK